MKFLDLTLPNPSANLALDEALLDACEEQGGEEMLRFWEPNDYFVVLGYANKVDEEVRRDECLQRNIPILRRCSGGGTVLQGPGCFNYSVVLQIRDELQGIPQTNMFVMERNRRALESLLGKRVEIRGHTDLAANDLKFSGNAQRRKKNFLVFHGTFLLGFDLQMIEAVLKFPSKQPDYRKNRSHLEFLTRLDLRADDIKSSLKQSWNATTPLEKIPDYYALLEKYRTDEWNLKF